MLRHGKGAFVAPRAKRLSERASRDALRRLARALAVEATQMAAPRQEVLDLVDRELRDLDRGGGADLVPRRRRTKRTAGGRA